MIKITWNFSYTKETRKATIARYRVRSIFHFVFSKRDWSAWLSAPIFSNRREVYYVYSAPIDDTDGNSYYTSCRLARPWEFSLFFLFSLSRYGAIVRGRKVKVKVIRAKIAVRTCIIERFNNAVHLYLRSKAIAYYCVRILKYLNLKKEFSRKEISTDVTYTSASLSPLDSRFDFSFQFHPRNRTHTPSEITFEIGV